MRRRHPENLVHELVDRDSADASADPLDYGLPRSTCWCEVDGIEGDEFESNSARASEHSKRPRFTRSRQRLILCCRQGPHHTDAPEGVGIVGDGHAQSGKCALDFLLRQSPNRNELLLGQLAAEPSGHIRRQWIRTVVEPEPEGRRREPAASRREREGGGKRKNGSSAGPELRSTNSSAQTRAVRKRESQDDCLP